MVKQQDATGNLIAVKVSVIYGDKTTLERTGDRTVYVERTNLTSRQMTGPLVRKTLGFSKRVEMLKVACIWENVVYNLSHSVKTLRTEIHEEGRRWIPRSPAMVAGLTDHIRSIRDVLMMVPVPTNTI